MPSNAISPSIDQGAKLNFQESFHELAQQTKSKLASAGVLIFANSKGKTNNMARIGRLELVEVDTRNPNKANGDYALDNRQFSKRRFTRTITIDNLYDVNQLLKDPTSDILKQLNNAKERVIDRIAISAAIGNVLVGAPDQATTSITAAADGVLTIDGTAGIVYTTIQKVTENFINNDIPYEDFAGSAICVTGKENTALMGDEKFINTDYITSNPGANKDIIKNANGYRVELFAGSVNGGITVPSPILPEGDTTRKCVVMAPKSILMAMEIGTLDVSKNPLKVNSTDITIDFWINAMRTEGVLVQIITATI